MSSMRKATAYRDLALGIKVDRATATTGLVGTTATLFTVSVGRVVGTSLDGELTVATGATSSSAKLISTPTTGTAVDLTSAVSVASKEIGAKFSLPLTLGGALSVTTAGAGQIPGAVGFVIAVGTIQLNTTADPTGGGSAKWSITYYPYDDGATVA
jgi:hypothetical protein